MTDPTVLLAVGETELIRVDKAPTAVSWAAGSAAPPASQPLPLHLQPFQSPPFQSQPIQPQSIQPQPMQPQSIQPQSSQSPQSPPPFDTARGRLAPPSPRRSGGLVAAIVVAGLLLAGGGYAAVRLTVLKDSPVESASALPGTAARGSKTPSSAAIPSPVAIPIKPTPAPTPTAAATTVASGPAAKAQLEALVAQDAAAAIVRGQWVAQLSSKSEGVVDTTLQAKPFTVPDILAEHLRLRNDPGFGSIVRLIHLGDWGAVATPASPMWITVADVNGGSLTEVATWCEAHFSQRGTALDNVCLPRELSLKTG